MTSRRFLVPGLLVLCGVLLAGYIWQNRSGAESITAGDAGTTEPSTPHGGAPAAGVAQAPPSSATTDTPSAVGARSTSEARGAAPDDGTIENGSFLATFDGSPPAPALWRPADWDVQRHSRDQPTWERPEAMAAQHSGACDPPGPDGSVTHPIASYDEQVFRCRDHVMTALNASGYGAIYLTPPALADFSRGEAVIRFDVSTLRTSGRDWWDVWLTPYEDNLALPLQPDLPDLMGAPRRALQAQLGFSRSGIRLRHYVDHRVVQDLNPEAWPPYEQVLTPSAQERSTFEIRVSRTRFRMTVTAAGTGAQLVLRDEALVPPLDWDRAVVQFGQHSYTPTKDCAPGPACRPNTYHWDNVAIAPSLPLDIIPATPRQAAGAGEPFTLARPAPANAMLRFHAVGNNVRVSFDGGPYQPARRQMERTEGHDDFHGHSYWTPIPAGTRIVRFVVDDQYGAGTRRVKDVHVWSRDAVP